MGGHKHKGQAQRTKNNTKPANSGRIAELVSKGQQFQSFTSFGENFCSPGQNTISNVVIDAFSPNVDPNFLVVLKKLNKKDATTRYKALQELKELCKGSSAGVIVEVLPVWCRIYTLLAIDVEHRVREAVQEVHRLVVSAVGRNLAPHLKVVAPLWFLSQYDSYAPAASAATIAFQEAFPPHKVAEVIAFCQVEILQYIQDSLLNLTPQSLTKGDLTKEEMELKYERIIICCLNGLALYLSKVSHEEINKHINVHKDIISSPKFWKFAKNKSSGIRSAWFSLLSAICKYAVFLLENEKKHVANTVIGSIDDYDSSVLSVAWEAALRSFTVIKDFWLHISIEKFFLPKFCNILRVGGQGNASSICPNILLLLNSIPSSVIKDKEQFYGKIFTNFKEGMKQPLTYQSHSESVAIMTSYTECIQYIIMKNVEDLNFCTFILDRHLFEVISLSTTGTSFRYQLKPFYHCLSHMLISWRKNEATENYKALIQHFWSKFSSVILDALNNSLLDKDVSTHCLNSHFQILSVLESPGIVSKKKLKVSFVDEAKSNDLDANINNISVVKGEDTLENQLWEHVFKLARELLHSYYKLALNEHHKQLHLAMITQIKKVICLFPEHILDVINSFEPDWPSSLLLWLQNKEIPVEYIINVFFETSCFIQPSQRQRIISELIKEHCKVSLIEGLKLASQKDIDDLNQWLQSDVMRTEICGMYDEIDSVDSSLFESWKHCLLLNKTGDFIIGHSTFMALIEKFEEQLLSKDETKIKIATKGIDILFEHVSTVGQLKHGDILARLLEPLFINIVHGKGSTVYETWQKGAVLLSKYPPGNLEKHLQNLSTQLGTYITSTEIVDARLIHRSVIALLSVLVGNDKKKMEEFGMPCIRLLLTSVFTTAVKESQRHIEHICLDAEMVNGNLPLCRNTLNDNTVDGKWNPLQQINALGFVNSLIFSIKVIASALGIDINSDMADGHDEDEDVSENLVTLPTLPKESKHEFCDYLVELSYHLVLLKKFQTYYYTTKEYFSIECFVGPLENDIRELVQRCEYHEQEKIISIINSKCTTNGRLWFQVKECIWDFLDGTHQDNSCTEVMIRPEESESLIPSSVLEVNYIQKLRKVINNKAVSKAVLCETITIISERYKMDYPPFNKPKDLSLESKEYLILSAEIARLYETAVAKHAIHLNVQSWDFIRISAVIWLNSISITTGHSENYVEIVALTKAACLLLTTLSETFFDENHPSSLDNFCDEWKEVFAADAFYFLFKCWESVVDKSLNSDIDHIRFLNIEMLSECIRYVCSRHFYGKVKLNGENVKDWIDVILTGILAPSTPVQLASYWLLVVLLPYMMELDEGLDESSLDKISCNMLTVKLLETQTVVLAMLQDYSVGISCSVKPFTDSYTYSLGYLLIWYLLIQFCHECKTQQKYLYPLWIREKDIVSHFMEAAIKLMPENVLYFQDSGNKKVQELFTSCPPTIFSGWTSEKLSHLCCYLLTDLMRYLPAVIRQWASEAEPKQLSLIDRITVSFISPYLCSLEMKAIKCQQKSFDNMKVHTHPSVREVIAVYTVEESSTELSIQLSNNYPLSPPKVDVSKAMVSSSQTRQCLKHLTIFLTHQNGSLWDGLILWKSNLDKRFEGIEECYICFSILHSTTHQLPKQSCHTCKKKFHSFCLYKWFSTSNKSTCPICRAIF